ncbi:MAG: TonB-dependent receptor plug domain-containing protein [Povalibacter sp.]
MKKVSRAARHRASAALTGTILSLAVSQVLADAAAEETKREEVVVTGTRVVGVEAVESASPIQVLGATELTSAGKPDLMNALANTVPSFTAQAFGGDMANQTLQAKLRGLSPNHVLVLVNGKRRHTTASLAVLGGPYQGGAGVDLNFIPVDSIDHVEVLTEGAAAQYGTDAIAGVINIILKKDATGGGGSYTHGGFYAGDGETDSISGSMGFAPSATSFLNFAGEWRQHEHTDRGGIDPRVVDPVRLATSPNSNMPDAPGYPYLNQIFGDAEYDMKLASFNAGVDITDNVQLYSFGTYGEKNAASFENYRLPNRVVYTNPTTAVKTYLYPLGFSPTEESEEKDYQMTAGVQGALGGEWRYDLATTYGKDEIDMFTRHSANASLFAETGATPVNFYDGTYTSTQWTTSLDLSKEFDVGLAGPMTFAFGGEYREETWEAGPGDEFSRYLEGGQSFPGISLSDAGSHDRDNVAAYVDFALEPIDGLKLDLAGRYEDYSDFGDTTVGKLSGRYDFTSAFAMRGTVSTGFRAPTLAEEFYSATNVGPSTAFVQMPPNAPATAILGLGAGLQPEKSTSYSLGFVMRPVANMALTIDVYQVEVRNRIAATSTFYGTVDGELVSQQIVNAIIANGNTLDPAVTAEGDTGINLFTNGLTTRTRGVDVVFDYATDYGPVSVDWSAAATFNETKITKVRETPPEFGTTQALFDPVALSDIQDTAPDYVINLGGTSHWDRLTVGLHEIVYGGASEFENNGSSTFYKSSIGATAITNLDVSFEVMDGFSVTLGAVNLFDTYPDKRNADFRALQFATGDNGAVPQYPSFSAFGINGGYYYGKVAYKF